MNTFKDYMINNREIFGEQKDLKFKVFNYFHSMLSSKYTTGFTVLYILHILEIIQLISFAFSQPLILIWNLSDKVSEKVEIVISGFRLVPLFKYTTFETYSLILIFLFAIIIIFSLGLIIQILFYDENSKFFTTCLFLSKVLIPYLTIFFFLPINELFLFPLRCQNNKLFDNEIVCWKNRHLFYAIIGIVGDICFITLMYVLNNFYFYPFLMAKSSVKLNPAVDLLLIKIKVIYELQSIFIKNKYTAIIIILILSTYLMFYNFQEQVYNYSVMEAFLNLRNVLVFWTFFILLIAKICSNSNFNKLIYMLVLSYPLVILSFIMFNEEKGNKIDYNFTDYNDIKTCIARIRFFFQLIATFIEEHRPDSKFKENINQKNEIILKGIISIHNEFCLKEDCPLTKFVNSDGNFVIQKQCLLSYMTIIFNDAIKKFPNDILIRMYYIQFSYDHKYNLNCVRETFEEIKKLKFGLKLQFNLFCQEKTIILLQMGEVSDGNEEEKEKLLLEQDYNTLKNLISNATKLYAEFWGIFATNVTNNLNTSKLYKLGEKLNDYLKEINNLWNNLKNKKINYENQIIAFLYLKFLKEILWDQKKSEEVQKKINEERNIQGFNKNIDEFKGKINNIDTTEKQDFIIYVNSNEKGNCNIVHFSNSLSFQTGYQKHEIINKPLEALMPSIFIEGHSKTVENFIKHSNIKRNLARESFNISENKSTFILIKTKIGYIIPFNAKFILYDDNDFSNSFLIKANLELTDKKSMYPYYLLTNSDFILESISSSAIHLGLTLDLLKKYVINLNVLIRTYKNNTLNLYEKYEDYENNERMITWVFPDIIYPKNDIDKKNDKQIKDLINYSTKKRFYLQIFEMKYKHSDIIGFVFKIFESKNITKKLEIAPNQFIPKDKTQIIFDLINLNYIRTVVVQKKSGFRNLRESDEEKENNALKNKGKDKKKKIKLNKSVKNNEYDSEEDDIEEIVITKEKLIELQTKDSIEIKSFINILPFYGSEISSVKHRPNREKYSSGKAQEPLIKISMSNFTKRIDSRFKEKPKLFKRLNNFTSDMKIQVNQEESKKNQNQSNLKASIEENKNAEIESDDINKGINGNSSSLSNVINIISIKIIKYFDFLIYLFVSCVIIVEFILTNNFYGEHIERYIYFTYSYRFLHDLSYIKYFITEGILENELESYSMNSMFFLNHEPTHIEQIKNQLTYYHKDISKIISELNSPKVSFSKKYNEFVSSEIINIKSISNGFQFEGMYPFNEALTRLTTALYYVSDRENTIEIKNKYSYELMINLLDSYYITFEQIILIMSEDLDEDAKYSGIKNIIIFSLSLFVSVVFLIIYFQLMLKLDNDREKPINLFLTIKNKVFEDLKNSSENFSNTLLNKFFGVDENEEESQKNYRANIKPNDINIAKFKALNEYRVHNNQGNSFISYFLQLTVFYGIILLILLAKYLNTIFYYQNISKYIHIYNSTYFSEIYLVTSVDIMKQYLYNESIVNYGFTIETQIQNFMIGFLSLSPYIEMTMKELSKTDCFLNARFKKIFIKNYYDDFSEIVNKQQDANYKLYSYAGFKSIDLELLENIRFLYINYFIDPQRNQTNSNVSELINNPRWLRIDVILFKYLEPWYDAILKILDDTYINYAYNKKYATLYAFLIMIIGIFIFYWIFWKRYESQFIYSIEKSFDLINLIPEEIKNIIANKLNENS